MRLDLRTIVNVPGSRLPFEFDPQLEDLVLGSVKEISGSHASGEVKNEAGILTLKGVLEADVTCVCARCLKEITEHMSLDVTAGLAEEVQDEESGVNDNVFLLDGGFADLDEIFATAFVLSTEQRFLCSEDCKGLCSKCGKNLNDGPCDCKDEGDPRLAVLRQLLENED